MRDLIVHIARIPEWREAQRVGAYEPPSLDESGFIHFSRPDQVHLPANALFSGEPDLVLLWVDASRLRAELRLEPPEPGASHRFPHLYGPLNLDAVVAETRLAPWDEGEFRLPTEPSIG